MTKQFTAYGGHGVSIGLKHSENTDQVFWVNGNSYVIVRSDKGEWSTRAGCVTCCLLSINGIGEIRWAVSPRYPEKGEMQAAVYFDLAVAY